MEHTDTGIWSWRKGRGGGGLKAGGGKPQSPWGISNTTHHPSLWELTAKNPRSHRRQSPTPRLPTCTRHVRAGAASAVQVREGPSYSPKSPQGWLSGRDNETSERVGGNSFLLSPSPPPVCRPGDHHPPHPAGGPAAPRWVVVSDRLWLAGHEQLSVPGEKINLHR